MAESGKINHSEQAAGSQPEQNGQEKEQNGEILPSSLRALDSGRLAPVQRQQALQRLASRYGNQATGRVIDRLQIRRITEDRMLPNTAGQTAQQIADQLRQMGLGPDYGQIFSTLNGLGIYDLLHTLQLLKDWGLLVDLESHLATAPETTRPRLRVAFAATNGRGTLSSEDFEVANSADLGTLPPADRYAILETIARESPLLRQLRQTAGFQALTPAEQTRLLDYVGGVNPIVSGPARTRLDILLNDPVAHLDDPQTFRTFLTGPNDGAALDTPAGTFTGSRAAYTIGAATAVAHYHFTDSVRDAERYDVTIGTQVIPVYRPAHPSATAGNFHTIEQVAMALGALPEGQRSTIRRVHQEPTRNPADAHWAQVYHQPGFSSYMTAGADGVVQIYPTSDPIGQDFMDGSIIHETGHILSEQHWGSDSQGAGWRPWRNAMRDDGNFPSGYAMVDPAEDFSEALKVYAQMMTRPPEERAEIRRQYPHRFDLIDSLLAHRS